MVREDSIRTWPCWHLSKKRSGGVSVRCRGLGPSSLSCVFQGREMIGFQQSLWCSSSGLVDTARRGSWVLASKPLLISKLLSQMNKLFARTDCFVGISCSKQPSYLLVYNLTFGARIYWQKWLCWHRWSRFSVLIVKLCGHSSLNSQSVYSVWIKPV